MHKCIVKPVDFKNLCLPPSHKDILLHFSIKVVWFQHLHLGFGSIFYFSYSFVLLRYNSHYHQSVQFSGFQYIHRVVQSSSQFIFYVLHKKKKKKSCYPLPFSLLPSLWKALIYFLSLQIYLFWIFHINGKIQYMTCFIWPLSLA